MSVSKEQARQAFEEHVTEGDLKGIDEDTRPRIILVAKQFRPEVTATVLWPRESFGMDVACVQLVPYMLGEELVLTSSVLIPLPEASEYVVQREAKRTKAQTTRR